MYLICTCAIIYLGDIMVCFDEVIHSEFRDSVIDYGIIYGSNTIVFIKAGQDGSMCG